MTWDYPTPRTCQCETCRTGVFVSWEEWLERTHRSYRGRGLTLSIVKRGEKPK